MLKFDDIIHWLTHNFVYIASLAVALCVDFISYGLAVILHLPTSSTMSLSEYLSTGSSPMGHEEFIIRAVDHNLMIWDISAVNILQIAVAFLSLFSISLKIILDLRKAYKERKEEMNYKKRNRK